mmetsp:Transcript_74692/g.132120  ORF Transcript_74692/g.132120 Transcript_74692/m.132120 type:complete len:179 (-) Transcript_74692:115-651(-)
MSSRAVSMALAAGAFVLMAPAFVPTAGPSSVRPERHLQEVSSYAENAEQSDFTMTSIKSLAAGTMLGLMLALGAAPAKAGLLSEFGVTNYDQQTRNTSDLVMMGKQGNRVRDISAEDANSNGAKADKFVVAPEPMKTVDVAQQFPAQLVASFAEQAGKTSVYAAAGFDDPINSRTALK